MTTPRPRLVRFVETGAIQPDLRTRLRKHARTGHLAIEGVKLDVPDTAANLAGWAGPEGRPGGRSGRSKPSGWVNTAPMHTLTPEAASAGPETFRLITTIADPHDVTAVELAAAYAERWEYEMSLREIQT